MVIQLLARFLSDTGLHLLSIYLRKGIVKETLNSNKTDSPDARLKSLRHWLLAIGYKDFSLDPASQDASFRRYFRMTLKDKKSLILWMLRQRKSP